MHRVYVLKEGRIKMGNKYGLKVLTISIALLSQQLSFGTI